MYVKLINGRIINLNKYLCKIGKLSKINKSREIKRKAKK